MLRLRPRSGGVRVFVLMLAGIVAHSRPVAAEEEFPAELKTIAAVHLEGRHHVSAKEIRTALKTRPPSIFPWSDKPVLRRDFMVADTAAIKTVYGAHGYLDAHASYRLSPARGGRSVVVTFSIVEGRQSRISAIEFLNVRSIPVDAFRKKLFARHRRPFNPAYLIADTTIISAAYEERGYLPHVVGSARRDSLDSLRVIVRYDVNEGPQYRYGEVYYSSPGEAHVREYLIRRELLIKPGEIFRASRVQRSIERLYGTSLFSQVQMAPLVDSTNTRVEFDLRVRERKPHWIDAGVGSGTTERFRFTGEWGNRNLFGRGLQGALSSRLAFDGHAHFLLTRTEASLTEPWLLRTRTRGRVTPYFQASDDRADPRWIVHQQGEGITFEVRRELGRYTQLLLTQDNNFVHQRIDFLDPTVSQPVRDSLTLNVTPRYTTHRVQLGLERDSRDDFLSTTRGTQERVTAETAGGPLQGTSSYHKLQLILADYSVMRRGWVLATRFQGGVIRPFGRRRQFSPEIGLDPEVAAVPLEFRFRIGGVNSLRGFNESEVPLPPASGGLALLLGNVELRVPVVGPFGLEFYMDAGNVWARPSYIKARNFAFKVGTDRLDPSDVRYVFGVGGRLNLPFGPLRVDVSWTPRPDENGRWRRATTQFAIGPSF